jgi:hypothetical protein
VDRSGLRARKAIVRVADAGPRRGWRQIRALLQRGDLDARVRLRALDVFRRLLEAEAEAHGVPFSRIHLHEAGALDAIVDVVGACAGLGHLAPDRIVVSEMTTGHGRILCAHGSYPVPGPATLLMLRGVPSTSGGAEGERLTPTGAAILTTFADAYGSMPAMCPAAAGYGAGDREFHDRPNVLRMVLGEEIPGGATRGTGDDDVLVIEVTLDDASPQVVAYAVERLFESGALEVFTTPVQMKKGRSGHLLTVLGRPADLAPLSEILFVETTTLGLRYRNERRLELERSWTRVKTAHGPVRVKIGSVAGLPSKAWPEYEDCAAIARRSGVALKQVQEAALRAFHRTRRAKESR